MQFVLMCMYAGLLVASQPPEAAQNEQRLEVLTPKPIGIEATGLNEQGQVIGFDYVESVTQPGVMEPMPFVASGKEMTYLPKLEGFTATFPEAISDDGVIVGRVSKPSLPGVFVMFRFQAFTWDAQKGIRGLGCLPGDNSSLASGISRDGKRISGTSVGNGKVRMVVWNRDGDAWRIQEVGQRDDTVSSRVAISPNGELLASCDGGIPCLWTHKEGDKWERETIGKMGELLPRAVNDAGCVAGVRYPPDGTVRAVVWTRPKGCEEIALPAGYVRAEARDINNAGQVVGFIDGPHGSPIGPDAFVFEGGMLRIVTEGGKAFTMANAINDRGQVAGVVEEEEEPAAADGPNKEPSTPKP